MAVEWCLEYKYISVVKEMEYFKSNALKNASETENMHGALTIYNNFQSEISFIKWNIQISPDRQYFSYKCIKNYAI